MVENYNDKMNALLDAEVALEAHIEDIKDRKFYLSMKDMWNKTDWAINKGYTDEIAQAQKELKSIKAAIHALVTANYCIA